MEILKWLHAHMLPCFFKSLTGMDCPGCGFQRSFLSLLSGHVHESFVVYSPLFPILFTLLFLPFHLNFHFTGQQLLMKGLVALMIGSIVVNYVIKLI